MNKNWRQWMLLTQQGQKKDMIWEAGEAVRQNARDIRDAKANFDIFAIIGRPSQGGGLSAAGSY